MCERSHCHRKKATNLQSHQLMQPRRNELQVWKYPLNLRKLCVYSYNETRIICKMSQFALILFHQKGYFQCLWLSGYCFSSLGFFPRSWNITLRCAFIFWMITFHREGHISWLTEHSFTCNLCAKHRHTMWNSVFPVCAHNILFPFPLSFLSLVNKTRMLYCFLSITEA